MTIVVKLCEHTSTVEECIFVYTALHIEYRFNKNLLLRSYFKVFLLFDSAWDKILDDIIEETV